MNDGRGTSWEGAWDDDADRRRHHPAVDRGHAVLRGQQHGYSGDYDGRLRWVMATPQFHHWHHGAEPEAVDKNFAVHLPLLDRMFGTCHLPGDRWPASYGLAAGKAVPPGYVRQLVDPFISK